MTSLNRFKTSSLLPGITYHHLIPGFKTAGSQISCWMPFMSSFTEYKQMYLLLEKFIISIFWISSFDRNGYANCIIRCCAHITFLFFYTLYEYEKGIHCFKNSNNLGTIGKTFKFLFIIFQIVPTGNYGCIGCKRKVYPTSNTFLIYFHKISPSVQCKNKKYSFSPHYEVGYYSLSLIQWRRLLSFDFR